MATGISCDTVLDFDPVTWKSTQVRQFLTIYFIADLSIPQAVG